MRKISSYLFLLCFLTGCIQHAADPFQLAPNNPYSTWTPLKGNQLVSAQYCPPIIPPSFESSKLSLAELIDIALQNNPSTKKSWATARSAAAQYGQSLSPFYPSIGFDGSFLRVRNTETLVNAQFGALPGTSESSPSPDISQNQFGVQEGLGSPIPYYQTQVGPDLTLALTLFDFGQRTSAALAAKEALYYADLMHNQQIQTVIQRVLSDSYSYLYNQALQEAYEENLANAQMSLDAANERFSLGLAALGDVAQARTQYLQTRINLTQQKQEVETAFAQLAKDLGLPSNLKFHLQPMPEEIEATPILTSLEELIEKAQSQRQDLLAARADCKSKEALVLNAKRAVYPVLGTALDLGHYWFQDGMQEVGPHWSVAFSLTFPIFQGFYYKNGVKNAKAKLEASQALMLEVELEMIQKITVAHMAVETAAQILEDTKEYLKAAELEFDIALAGYKAGTMTILDVMSAQSSLADARAKKAKSEKDWFLSLADLAYATGSLCTSSEPI